MRRAMAAAVAAALALEAAVLAGPLPVAAQNNPNAPPPPAGMTVWGSVATLAGQPVYQGAIQGYLDGQPAGNPVNLSSPTGGFGTPVSLVPGGGPIHDLVVAAGSAADQGRVVAFTVGGAAAAATVVRCAGDALAPGATLTYVAGAACQVLLIPALMPPGASVGGASAAATRSAAATVTAGGSGTSVPDLSAAASGGAGTVAVSQYMAPPEPSAQPLSQGAMFFDASVAPESTFTHLEVQACSAPPGAVLYWFDGTAWAPVSPQSSATSGCLTGLLNESASSPLVSQLGGMPLAVAAAGAAAAPPESSGSSPAKAPVVSAISPASGPAAGGTTVTVSGHGFTGAYRVSFGANAAVSLQVDFSGQITAVSPPGSGQVDVTVTAPGGTSAATAVDRFSYTSATSPVTPSGSPSGAAAAAPPSAPPVPHFSDVPAGFWAQSAIDALIARGVLSGFPDGRFEPDAPLTRAELVKMLVLAFGLKPSPAATPFTDVAAGDWFAPYVAAAVRAGLVQGVTATSFDPGAPVTRQELAVLVARALHLQGSAALDFTDAGSIAPWAVAGVRAVVAAGLMSGFPGGSFKPLGIATRAQAAQVLAAALTYAKP